MTWSKLHKEEQDYYDNMPENMQSGERGDNASADAETLNNWATQLEEAADVIDGMDTSEFDH